MGKLNIPRSIRGFMAYTSVAVRNFPGGLDIVLNDHESDGWKLVAITPINQGGQDHGAWTDYLIVTFQK